MAQWFLLQTKPRQELRAVENLERQHVTVFCPQVYVEKVIRGRCTVSQEILFSGYLFVSFNHYRVSVTSVRSTRGVSRFVSFDSSPVTVPEQLITQLQQRVDLNSQHLISQLPAAGDQLQIMEGPFRGLNAVFSQIDGDRRAVVLINLLSQQVKAVLPLSSLSPVVEQRASLDML